MKMEDSIKKNPQWPVGFASYAQWQRMHFARTGVYLNVMNIVTRYFGFLLKSDWLLFLLDLALCPAWLYTFSNFVGLKYINICQLPTLKKVESFSCDAYFLAVKRKKSSVNFPVQILISRQVIKLAWVDQYKVDTIQRGLYCIELLTFGMSKNIVLFKF